MLLRFAASSSFPAQAVKLAMSAHRAKADLATARAADIKVRFIPVDPQRVIGPHALAGPPSEAQVVIQFKRAPSLNGNPPRSRQSGHPDR